MFLLDPGVTYLNHGAFGACPEPVMRVFQDWQRELERQPAEFLVRRAPELLREAAAALAAYVGAEAVALIPNATVAMNMVARSLPLRAGDVVLTTDHEYGAVDRLWELVCERTGAELRRCDVGFPVAGDAAVLAAVESGLDERVRVVSISHITSPTGLVFPVAEVCALARSVGALSVVDGAHGPGQVELSLSTLGCDFYAGNCHKWLCAPKVAGFLYTRPGVEATIDPLVVSWGWDEPALAERVAWPGTSELSAYLSVPAAIDFVTAGDWRERCVRLAADLHARLPAPAGDVSLVRQMVAAEVPPHVTEEQFRARGIEVPVGVWRGRNLLRVSVAPYTSHEDLERLLSVMYQLSGPPL
ncbi:aminotransferase class V-fold PLP-dependent enzyme [Solirubrobacter soli]|uniref:aminotransferase class V-fold PLP-dependent enzyme n=1 Tax=Solirubrobacter soli TaxID=363832 RepID=UPI0004075DEA|nr:aminotransferase class V-fold PLP-dependent enzyme [Solirubrobacter soli]